MTCIRVIEKFTIMERVNTGRKLVFKQSIYLGLGILALTSTIHAEPNPPSKPALTAPQLTPEPIVPLNRIVAVVNDEIITQTDLDEAILEVKQQLLATHAPIPPEDQLRQDTLQ